jgi:hypothetical protein
MNNKGHLFLTGGADYIESLLTFLTVTMNGIAMHSSLFNRK